MEFRGVIASSHSATASSVRPPRSRAHVRARDWTVVIALGMGIASLLLMLLLFWL